MAEEEDSDAEYVVNSDSSGEVRHKRANVSEEDDEEDDEESQSDVKGMILL